MAKVNNYLVCRKCGAMVQEEVLKKSTVRRCFACDEPDLRFFELDKADWSTGDFFPDKLEKG